MSIEIIGTGSALPETILDNHGISKLVDTSDAWIKERTGIASRRLSQFQSTTDLAVQAACQALQAAQTEAHEIDLIVVATISPDNFIPSCACQVQARLGATNATCLDVSAACTGFIFGLLTANGWLATLQGKKALVIGAEVLSKYVDWKDRETCILFGDGAGAVVLKSASPGSLLAADTGSKADAEDSLSVPAKALSNPLAEISQAPMLIQMKGKEIFRFAFRTIIRTLRKLEEASGTSCEQWDYIIPHQANVRIIEAVAEKMGLPMEKFVLNADCYGNTSSASIAIALDELVRSGKVRNGDKLALVGFGGGLTWGSLLLEWKA